MAYGWTLPITFLAMWVITTSDRYMLQYFMTSTDVGRYAMNYGLWSMPFLFLNGWLEILFRPLVFEAAAKNNWDRVNTIIVWRIGVGLLASILGTTLIFLLAEPISSIMLSDQYWIDIKLVMVVAFAHCFFVLGYSVVPIFNAAKRLNMVFFATVLCSISKLIGKLDCYSKVWLDGRRQIATFITYFLWATILAVSGYMLVQSISKRKK